MSSIDLDDLYPQVAELHPVPDVDRPVRDNNSAVLVSLVMNRQDSRNVVP
jgi:hypothetical protein